MTTVVVKVKSYVCDLVVEGATYQLSYADGVLSVGGIDPAQAPKLIGVMQDVLAKLAAPAPATTPTVVQEVTKRTRTRRAPVAQAPTTVPVPVVQQTAQEAKPAVAAQLPPPQEPKVEAPKQEAPKAEPAPPTNVVAIDTAKREAPTGAVEIPPELMKATKLRDITDYFKTLGIETVEGVAAECEKYKPHVPLLATIHNLPHRLTLIMNKEAI